MSKHRDVIAIEREADQQVQVTIGQTTGGGREVDGGYAQLFNRVMQSGIYADLPLPARAVYTALVYLADNTRFFIVDGKESRGVNIDRIMAVSGCGETAVKASLKTLAARQLLRILRKGGSTPDGQRVASIYQLLLPVSGFENLHKSSGAGAAPGRNAPRYPSATRPGTPAHHDPVPPRVASRFPVAARPLTGAQNVHSLRSSTNTDSSKPPAADVSLKLLEERGVGAPLLDRILADFDPETIARHCLDFDLRNTLPGQPQRTPGWLAKSIMVPYDLHPKTVRKLEEQSRAAASSTRRARQQDHEARQSARLSAIDVWVEEQFSAADEEELTALKRKAIETYPSLARNLDKADPRTNPRLSRLIKGLLSSLYAE